MASDKEQGKKIKRPPVVVVLGHVDHGKTTLLDYIRKAAAKAAPSGDARSDSETRREPRSVAGREVGGITQSIGAYEIDHGGRRITFIDTPGHQAFSRMREHGAKVADIAILLVAADDGVEPQTKEAIKIVQDAKMHYVVAINKIDKEGVDVNRVKDQLTGEGVLLEGYGGSISCQPISAKTGQGVPELLDLILLAADIEELTYDPKNPGRGIILESKLDAKRGIIASGIMKDGTLRVGDFIAAGSATGKVKAIDNFLGKPVKEAMPSAPVLIFGFAELPEVGDEFCVGGAVVSRKANLPDRAQANAPAKKDTEQVLKVILKADVAGSLEALKEVIKTVQKPEGMRFDIVEELVGEISDGDVKLAISVGAIIIGFRVQSSKASVQLAQIHNIKIVTSPIVYELVKVLEEEFRNIKSTVVNGDLEILAVFGSKGKNQRIVGGRVTAGAIDNNSVLEILRRAQAVGTGKILNLQQGKKNVTKVEVGNECGLLMDSEVEIKAGDHLIAR